MGEDARTRDYVCRTCDQLFLVGGLFALLEARCGRIARCWNQERENNAVWILRRLQSRWHCFGTSEGVPLVESGDCLAVGATIPGLDACHTPTTLLDLHSVRLLSARAVKVFAGRGSQA